MTLRPRRRKRQGRPSYDWRVGWEKARLELAAGLAAYGRRRAAVRMPSRRNTARATMHDAPPQDTGSPRSR